MAEAIEVGSVLIIDDIMGHGSTVNEACRALRAAGFSTVMSLTLVKDVFGTRGYSFDVRYSNGGPADFASCRRLSRHRSRSEGVIDTCRRPTGSHRSSCYRHLRIASCIRFGDRESPPFWGTCNAVWVRRGLRKRARSRRRCTAKRTSCRWLDDRGAGRRVGQMEAAGRSPPAHQCATFRGRVEVRRRSGLDGLAGDGQKQLDHRAGSSVGRRSSSNHGRNMGGRSRVSQAGQAPACRRGFQHLAGGRREPRTHRSGRNTRFLIQRASPDSSGSQNHRTDVRGPTEALNLRQLHAGGGRRRPDNGHWVALFGGSEFTARNPVSQVMQGMLAELDGKGLEAETAKLKDFYASVERRVQGVDNSEARQRVMAELYDRFFQTAFPRDAERLGIVYTPVEIVDFIIRSVAELLRREFGASLGDEGVHILDPFAGTGTFIVRLLQSGLISPDDLPRARPGDHGREPRGDRARGDGAHPGAAAPAPLRRGLLQGGLPAAGRNRTPARAAALRDHARVRAYPAARPGHRRRRTGPPPLRTVRAYRADIATYRSGAAQTPPRPPARRVRLRPRIPVTPSLLGTSRSYASSDA